MARARRTVADFTDPYVGHFTPPPPSGVEGVCEVCHSATSPGYRRCRSCERTISRVTHPVELVVPISLYEGRSQLHHVLRNYKDGYTDDVRTQLRPRVTALLWRFLSAHEPCIVEAAGQGWDFITSVPSSSDRAGIHPLEQAITLAPPLREQYRTTLERGEAPLDHNLASDDGYRVTADVEDAAVLLVDDTFTSGARVQSAASALALAGATVIAAVPIGRYINPDYSEANRRLWDAARAEGFDFEVCCLEP